jgi:hypothetical protein
MPVLAWSTLLLFGRRRGMFFQKAGRILPDCTALYLRKQNSFFIECVTALYSLDTDSVIQQQTYRLPEFHESRSVPHHVGVAESPNGLVTTCTFVRGFLRRNAKKKGFMNFYCPPLRRRRRNSFRVTPDHRKLMVA